ncbi:MAG: monovalent cation/H(+) antiporter subunit G [Anaerolineales bacterium]|nr:monovalent cation/H(+) antiporter subunit G [Anaerolineales bacterium]MBX3035663.1 monovalent cation/H(+) antiporter subunit G [Anaerolineales bacterium]
MNLLSEILMFIGAFFMFVAALGVFRMPDIYMRLHANTKSATFGVLFLVSGAAWHFWEIAIVMRAIIIVIFIFATAPVAAHMLGRAAYFAKAPVWKGTLSDDMKDKYDPKTHELAGIQKNHKPTTAKSKRDKQDD